MECLHPSCPMGAGLPAWADVLNDPRLKIRTADNKPQILANLAAFRLPGTSATALSAPTTSKALTQRLLKLCPCLYADLAVPCTADAIVHFCEISLGSRISAANVELAFLYQHPAKGPPLKLKPRGKTSSNVGDITEGLCSEVLGAAGIPRMELDGNDWPSWIMPGHVSLNYGKMRELKAYGDILIPCAPTNLVISVKTESARERLLYSSNVVESVGFGLFNQPNEFWTESRMRLYKRMGFSAIYMPDQTLNEIQARLNSDGTQAAALNLNGTALYRPLTGFPADMLRVVGRSILAL